MENNMQKMKLIKIAIIVLVVFILLLLLMLFMYNKSMKNIDYSDLENIPTSKVALELMNCKYLGETKSISENYDIDIFAEFDKDLFTGEESNEIYYSQLVQVVASAVNYRDFRLVDEKKQVEVAVKCIPKEKEIKLIIINGELNYYSKVNSYKQLKAFTKTSTTVLDTQAQELEILLNNDWRFSSLNVTYPEQFEDGYVMYTGEGLKIRTINQKVFNIVFTMNYEANVLNNLNTTSSLEAVVQILGTPTFGSIEKNCIGYKDEKMYVFFNGDEVSIYRVEENTKVEEFAEEVENYLKEDNLKKFVSNVTDIWPDYSDYYYDANTIDLSYDLRGLKIQYGISENHGITYYNNYQGQIINGKTFEELSKEEKLEIPEYIYFRNEDSIAVYEMARTEKYRMMLYDGEEDEDI